jgi:hypothetical protein
MAISGQTSQRETRLSESRQRRAQTVAYDRRRWTQFSVNRITLPLPCSLALMERIGTGLFDEGTYEPLFARQLSITHMHELAGSPAS